MQPKFIPTPQWCQRAEGYIIIFLPSHWLLNLLSFLFFDPNEAFALAVCDSSCADPGTVLVGCLCYRRLFFSCAAIKAKGTECCRYSRPLLSYKGVVLVDKTT